MKDREIRPEQALKNLAWDQVPADSRHARQLARRQMMAEAVLAEGTMRIEDLTERFGISLMTVPGGSHDGVPTLALAGM